MPAQYGGQKAIVGQHQVSCKTYSCSAHRLNTHISHRLKQIAPQATVQGTI